MSHIKSKKEKEAEALARSEAATRGAKTRKINAQKKLKAAEMDAAKTTTTKTTTVETTEPAKVGTTTEQKLETANATAAKTTTAETTEQKPEVETEPSWLSWLSQNWIALLVIGLLVIAVIWLATRHPAPATVAQPTGMPTGTPSIVFEPTATKPAATATSNIVGSASGATSFTVPGDINTMPSTVIELAPMDAWFHRVFNTRLFNAANNWGGADSWFVTLALGQNSGGNWTSMGNPGQVVYRATDTHITWTLGVLTTGQWKSQNSTTVPAAINVRIAPYSVVTVTTASGKVIQQATSDMGDITVILPDSGVISIAVDYTTAAPTHESLVWWGPYDRSKNINTVDAR